MTHLEAIRAALKKCGKDDSEIEKMFGYASGRMRFTGVHGELQKEIEFRPGMTAEGYVGALAEEFKAIAALPKEHIDAITTFGMNKLSERN